MMRNLVLFTFVILFLVVFSCNNAKKEISPSNIDLSENSFANLSAGFQLLENNCFSCHSPNASIENRVAPPMEAIKRHYITDGVTQERFTSDLMSFLDDPTEEKSKMPNAVKRFNLMPKMNLTEEQIKNIATYIYQTELEKPEWFNQHYQEERKKYKSNSDLTPVEFGQSVAMKTKGILGKNLLEAINTIGTEKAISFCYTEAIPLTDSMAVAQNASIKRVSDRNRNPNNAANKEELDYILKAKDLITKGEKVEPQLSSYGDKRIGYYPIMANAMCMQCHGQKNTEILSATLVKINEIYPKDRATGYKPNELRGIWVVEFDK